MGRAALPTEPGPDDDAFWPWLAGFIDGEGSIGWTTANRYPAPYVSIAQNVRGREVMEEIVRRCGGSIHQRPVVGFTARAPMLCARIAAQSSVERTLRNTEPHLRLKRDRALQTLALIESLRSGDRENREWLELEDAYLKRHAWRLAVAELAVRLRRTEGAIIQRRTLIAPHPPVALACPLCGGPVTGNPLKRFCWGQLT